MKKGGKGSLMQYVAMSAVRATIIIACLFCAGRAGAGDLRSEVTKGPVENQLAFLNDPAAPAAKLDAALVARFRSLLDQLVQTYSSEDEGQIANWSVKMQGALESYGIKETLLNMMEGINSLNLRPGRKATYKDSLTAYATLRNKGRSHKDAVAALPGYIKELQANGTIKR